jgi:two-component system sensor kinase FixL
MSPADPNHPPTVSEARLESVLDTAADGIVVIDDRGTILVFNKACERLFGITAGRAVGRNVNIIMASHHARAHDGYLAHYISTGERRIIGIGREVEGRHADGTIFPVELSVGEAATPDGRQFIGILRDLRPRKDAEKRLADLQADLIHMARVSALDEMGSAIAHELNQPLTALMLYLQTLSRGAERGIDHPVAKSVLDKAFHEADRAGAIIRRMRQFVEKRAPDRQRLDLNPLVEDAVELASMGRRRRARLVRDLGPDGVEAVVDPVQIQQVIVNLVRNALDVVGDQPEGQVRIITKGTDAGAEIVVEDNGPGIPAERLPSLFKAFSSTKSRGMGLGLAISKSIAQNHGGDLIVEPGGEGRGARFVLILPVRTPRQQNGGGDGSIGFEAQAQGDSE